MEFSKGFLVSSQTHLSKNQTINLGSFYTPKNIVKLAYELLSKHINLSEFKYLDSSCGYGDFFTENLDYIGADIDKFALDKANINIPKFHTNSLVNVNRNKFGLKNDDKLIIIGNPPYNDKTSIIRNKIKKEIFDIDGMLKHRDLGISFLCSYEILKPNFVCVLHPLSYLIKKSNFNALKKFRKNYRLIDDIVISSEIFTPNSSTFFPIIIALYEKNSLGMSYEFIKQYSFKTYENRTFALKNFDFIKNSDHYNDRKAVAYFHISSDIDVFKKNQTTNFIKTLDDFSNLSHNAKITQYSNNLLKVYA